MGSSLFAETVEDADWIHLGEDEEIRWTGRPSKFTIAVALALAALVTVLGFVASALLAAWTDLPSWASALPLLVMFGGIGWAIAIYLDWLRLLYVITDEQLYVKHGLISRDVTAIRLERVQNTSYEQTILERFLSFGDVRVFTAGTDTEDVTFRSVPNPERVKRTLAHLLSEQMPEGNGPRQPVQ